jgi:hypothetical protein
VINNGLSAWIAQVAPGLAGLGVPNTPPAVLTSLKVKA